MSDEHIKFLNCTDMTDKWPTYSDVSDVKFSLKWKVQIRQGDPCLESLVSPVLWLMASSSPPASWNSSWPVMPSSWPCKKQHVFSIVHCWSLLCIILQRCSLIRSWNAKEFTGHVCPPESRHSQQWRMGLPLPVSSCDKPLQIINSQFIFFGFPAFLRNSLWTLDLDRLTAEPSTLPSWPTPQMPSERLPSFCILTPTDCFLV